MIYRVCIIAIIFLILPCWAGVITVDNDGPADYSSIQDAIEASVNGDMVLVARGQYKEHLLLNGKFITLASFYIYTNNPEDVQNTIVDGGLRIDAVTTDTVVEGFTFQNANNGVSVHSKCTLLHNRILYCTDGISYENGGGGICRFNEIRDNSDDGIDCDHAVDVLIADNIIMNNRNDGIEIRLHSYSGPMLTYRIKNNIIAGSVEDGIQLIDYPDVSNRVFYIENNLIFNTVMAAIGCMANGVTNESYKAADIPEPIYVVNNTFVNNNYGITGGDNMTVKNNIFADTAQTALKKVDGQSILSYNLFWQNQVDLDGTLPGIGDIREDPLFADPASGDFHLRSQAGRYSTAAGQWINDAETSPGIDAGDPDSAFDSEPLPNGWRINMGAFGGTTEASRSPFSPAGPTYGGGSGSAQDPYQIRTAWQMNTLGTESSDWNKHFKILADIDMSAYTGTLYHIIGNSTTPFTGTFDGGRHSIRSLTYTTTEDVDYVGLFGYCDGAVIQNLGLENVTMATGGSFVGGLAGNMENSQVSACYVTGSVSGSGYVGGLIGNSQNDTIATCYAAAAVTGSPGTIGGLLGHNDSSSAAASFWDTQISGQSTSAGGQGKTTTQMQTLSTFTSAGWDFVSETTNGTNDIWILSQAITYPAFYNKQNQVQITRGTVAAGIKNNNDQISFAGTMNAEAWDLSAAGTIEITMHSELMASPRILTFPVNDKTFKNGNYSYSAAVNRIKQSLKCNTKTGVFTLTASKMDLAGLACPMIVNVHIGSYMAQTQLDETIINGIEKPCPVQLLRGLKDTLTVDKYKVKHGKNPDTDSFTARGTFTLGSSYDKTDPLVITLGTQSFTVPGRYFTNKNNVEICKKAVLSEGPIVDAKFDFIKCTYTISVKNAPIIQTGNVGFGINCFGVTLEGLATVAIQ